MPAESPNSDQNETSGPEVRYVLAGQPTGWAAMAKEVREFDEEKVRSCKEDIDTLLVFAGLFSAVLSAFLVAAYPSLQIDRMDTVVYTLQLIASQTAGYNIVGNAITSSNTPPSPPPPFKAAQNDIRVNVLWFASLIISLVTASFAMLVKQWLREFLSVDVPSPQARLRLRNFRQPQIETWLVYEIAASLPLLLQLSLGLFFIGLCYFTAAIHTSIRYTTLPLVVGWALFFFAATTLPIFFPRCPYRTTLLKTTIARLHQGIRSLAGRVWDRYRLILDETVLGPRLPPLSLRSFNVSTLWSSLLRVVFRSTLSGLRSLPDERGVVRTQDKDIGILISTDAILANDELLLTTISEALRYGHFHWTDVVDFVVQVLANRLPTIPQSERVLPAWPFSSAFLFSNLRPQIITGAIQILSENINISEIRIHYRVSALSPDALQDSEGSRLLCLFTIIIAAVLVDDNYISSNAGILCTLGWLLNARIGLEQLWKDWLRLAVGRNVAHEEPRGDPDQERIRVAYKLLYSFNSLLEHQPPGTLFLAQDGISLFETLMETNLNTWWQGFDWTNWEEYSALLRREGYLHHLLQQALQRLAGIPLYEYDEHMTILRMLESILHFTNFSLRTIQIRETAYGYSPTGLLLRLGETICMALENEVVARHLFNILSDSEAEHGTPNSICIQLARAIIDNSEIPALQSCPRWRQATPRVSPQGIANTEANIIREYDSVLQILRSCQAAMFVFRIVFIHKDDRPEVRRIFASLASLLRSHTVAAQHDEGDQRSIAEVAHICLLTMAMYQGWSMYDLEDEERFQEPLSIFPDTLVEVLMDIDVTESQDSLRSFFRIRRIEEKRARLAAEQAESPTSPPDIVAAPMASEAAREDDLNDQWSIKWHLDLGM